MKRILLIFMGLIVLCIFWIVLAAYGLYKEGLKALPQDIHAIKNTMYPEQIYDALWSELGGIGTPKMRPIASEIFHHFVRNDFLVSLRICETVTSFLIQRERQHTKRHYSPLELKAIALWLNRNWTIRQALGFIADSSYFGHGTTGFTEASQSYFGKPPNILDVEEAAVLVAIMFKPVVHDPWCRPENSLQRTNTILEKLNVALPFRYQFGRLTQLPPTLLPAPEGACDTKE